MITVAELLARVQAEMQGRAHTDGSRMTERDLRAVLDDLPPGVVDEFWRAYDTWRLDVISAGTRHNTAIRARYEDAHVRARVFWNPAAVAECTDALERIAEAQRRLDAERQSIEQRRRA